MAFTKKDFETARFAYLPNSDRRAVRLPGDDDGYPWYAVTLDDWFSDKDMAKDGWEPVIESAKSPLDILKDMWDNAEVTNTFAKGDTVISHSEQLKSFSMYEIRADWEVGRGLAGNYRRLTRANRLETILSNMPANLTPAQQAEYLRNEGVTV